MKTFTSFFNRKYMGLPDVHVELEAKNVLGNELVISIASEFIENGGEDTEKQRKSNIIKYFPIGTVY
ncbi:hypothetical protein [Anaerocolumna xylanovorans]|uniref:Uncharacterized protein n=1 Tax=Anaerocolumna xylanovorans DSM 12503 TaxID=1121345 RepID=A0A1M7XXN0_9FIRM|nr:hypothetical protein [Anaerocolumna xylanovorans]SHO43682.1 hypothetical protein SAMN02745217_00319 [Anaerocolumna xylanovorans DSM 12503]